MFTAIVVVGISLFICAAKDAHSQSRSACTHTPVRKLKAIR
jgi:hypothetical protein